METALAARPLWNIPNILTVSRVALIPVLLVLAYSPIGYRNEIAAAVFGIAAITDWFDGYLARTLNQGSAFGRFLDPVADKLMVAAALILLVEWHAHVVMVVPAIVIISREITISALREWMAEIGQRAQVAVSAIGKWKTAAQMVSITLLLLDWTVLNPLAWGLLYVSVVLTLWSMCIYLVAAWPSLSETD
jgi:CDP-diacylglycerol--glycerol-3-phosphate 3-phosphatidyltransferase